MRGFLKRHTETVVVAFVVAAVTAGAPAIAAVVQNAHHAHTADVARNAQHLGGVGPSRYLKTNSSVDAATLNGKSAADFLPTTGIAADSSKLGGQPAASYALAANVAAKAWVLVDNTGPTAVQSQP